MPVIDADAHVMENEHTWDFLDPADARYRPTLVTSEYGPRRQYWLIDGKVQGFNVLPADEGELEARTAKMGRVVYTPPATREMEDIPLRLKHMDDAGVDIQVCHATIFIERITDRPEVEVALCRSWNRWVADAWKRSQGRIRWTCVLPLLDMPEALTQLRWSVQNGACGVFLRPIESGRLLHEPYFFPLYEEAARLDIPMVIHVGNADPPNLALLESSGNGFWRFRLPCVGAFHSIVSRGLMHQFPKLRFAVVEAGAQWLPAALRDLERRATTQGRTLGDHVLRDHRIWVTCETDDDVPYVLTYNAGDHLVIGTDYGHADQSTEIDALSQLRRMPGVSEDAWRKIVADNPLALYGASLETQWRAGLAAAN